MANTLRNDRKPESRLRGLPLAFSSYLRYNSSMIIGELLKAYRWKTERGIRDVAKEIGTSHGTLSRIERGENVDGRTLAKVLTWAMKETQPVPAKERAKR